MNTISTTHTSEQRHRFLAEISRDHHKLLYKAFDQALFQSPAKDFATEPCDLEAEFYLFLLTNPKKLDELMAPGNAKSTTRIFSKAKWRARGYRTFLNDRSTKIGRYACEGCDFDTLRPSKPSDVEEDVRKNDIERAMRKLTARQRRILDMRYVNGFDVEAISKKTSTLPSAIQNEIKTACAMLRDYLPADFHGSVPMAV
jgi:hypothetical protein